MGEYFAVIRQVQGSSQLSHLSYFPSQADLGAQNLLKGTTAPADTSLSCRLKSCFMHKDVWGKKLSDESQLSDGSSQVQVVILMNITINIPQWKVFSSSWAEPGGTD